MFYLQIYLSVNGAIVCIQQKSMMPICDRRVEGEQLLLPPFKCPLL